MNVPSQAETKPDCLTELSDRFRTDGPSVLGYLTSLEGLLATREPLVTAFVPELSDRFERFREEFAQLESRFLEPLSRPPL